MADASAQLAQFKKTILTADSPLLGPQRRPGSVDETELSRKLADYFVAAQTPSGIQPLLRSAALLWHDHLNASHAISQNIETRDGSWLHGIMHRREPDYGNAKYWFRRVAPHEAFAELAGRVTAALKDDVAGLSKRLIDRGEWKPFAFIDECERAEHANDAALTSMLRKIQAVEFDVLVEHILQNA